MGDGDSDDGPPDLVPAHSDSSDEDAETERGSGADEEVDVWSEEDMA